jgi:hypothetical protein
MNIPKISALYESSLASALSAAGTSFTVVSGTDRDGNALSGSYGFVLDEGSADEEFVIGSISGTTVTITYRGIDADAPNTEVSANKKAHRRGASVKISDYPILGIIRNILNGDEGLPNKLKYSSTPTFDDVLQLVSKGYVDELTISQSGVPDGSTTTRGTFEEATQAEIDADTGAGATTARLAINPSTLATSKYGVRLPTANEKTSITNLAAAVLPYAADAGSSDSYAVTLSPAPSSYTAGMVVNFKANTVNTGAATLNVNSLGAKSIVKSYNVALVNGDIKANQIVSVIYDGTNFQMLSPVAVPPYAAGVTTRDMTAASGAVTIAHGLGVAPKRVKLTATIGATAKSFGTYDGTNQRAIYEKQSGAGNGNSTSAAIHLEPTSGDIQSAVATFDETNITLTWTKNTNPSGTAQILWEAFG